MRRTTVVLPEPLHESLRLEAFQKRMSMATLIRMKLEWRPDRASVQSIEEIEDPLLAVAGLGSDGSLTRHLDADLYGEG